MNFFLALTLSAIFLQGIFALFEMAAVSFNKVRLQYYVNCGNRRARWLHFLLKRPSRLFGTTLIAINTALQVGSEAARKFYESVHLDPDWAPLTQVFLVMIFGELAPLFAARRHPEQIALFLSPFMIAIARLFTPLIWGFDALSRLIHRLLGKAKELPLFLSREEIKLAFEEKGGEGTFYEQVGRIFQLKSQRAGQLMVPLEQVETLPFFAVKEEGEKLLSHSPYPFLLIHQKMKSHILSLATWRDLYHLREGQKIADRGRLPWFVSQDASVLEILEQFRRNNQSVAVILNRSGEAVGILTLDQIVEEIFGEERLPSGEEGPPLYLERTLGGDLSIAEFNRQFLAHLPGEGSLSDLIVERLEHLPVAGESLRIGPFEFTVEEPTLRGVKRVSVRTLQS